MKRLAEVIKEGDFRLAIYNDGSFEKYRIVTGNIIEIDPESLGANLNEDGDLFWVLTVDINMMDGSVRRGPGMILDAHFRSIEAEEEFSVGAVIPIALHFKDDGTVNAFAGISNIIEPITKSGEESIEYVPSNDTIEQNFGTEVNSINYLDSDAELHDDDDDEAYHSDNTNKREKEDVAGIVISIIAVGICILISAMVIGFLIPFIGFLAYPIIILGGFVLAKVTEPIWYNKK